MNQRLKNLSLENSMVCVGLDPDIDKISNFIKGDTIERINHFLEQVLH